MVIIINEKTIGDSDAFNESREIRAHMASEYDHGNLETAKVWAEKLINWKVPEGNGVAYQWALEAHHNDVRWASNILKMTDEDMQYAIRKYNLGHLLKAAGLRKHDKNYKPYLGMLLSGELDPDDVFDIVNR